MTPVIKYQQYNVFIESESKYNFTYKLNHKSFYSPDYKCFAITLAVNYFSVQVNYVVCYKSFNLHHHRVKKLANTRITQLYVMQCFKILNVGFHFEGFGNSREVLDSVHSVEENYANPKPSEHS